MTTWGRMPSAGFAHGQKWQLGPHGPQPVSGMANNGERRHAHRRRRRCCPSSMDRAVGGQEQHGSTQRQQRRDKRAPCSKSLIAARNITAMRQDQTRYGTTTLTVGPRANGPLYFAHSHTPWALEEQWARPRCGHGQKTTAWATWPSTGFGHGQQWGASTSALAQAPILSKLDGSRGGRRAKSNTDQRSTNKGGTRAPRAKSLIAARSITAMRQDQTRYGTTARTVGPRANGPLNSAH